MKKYAQASLLAFGTLWVSCSDETTVFQDNLQDEVILENSQTKLDGSINFDKAGVLDIYEGETPPGAGGKVAADQAGDYPLTLVAQVQAPQRSSTDNLTASHVHVSGDYAYVAYNTAGEVYSGAVEVIDISDPHNPRVTSRLFYVNADINAIQYDSGFVYIAGGTDAQTSTIATSNSFIAKIPMLGNRFLESTGIVYGFQLGYNATDLLIDGSRILSTSGKEGSLAVFSKADLSLQQELPFPDLRSLAMDNGTLALLDASLGVRVLDAGFNTLKEIHIDTDFGLATKKTLEIQGDQILVSEGAKGTGVYSISSGSLVEYVPIFRNPAGVDTADVVTNAVVGNEGVMFMANGGAGLCLTEEGSNGKEVVGIIELEGSMNYVASKDDYAFAASGREGLQIIKLNRPSESLRVRCSSLPEYESSSKLFVNTGEVAEFQGAKRFTSIDIRGALLLCGSWTVREDVKVDDDALFEMNGTLVVGRNNKKKKLKVHKNGTLRIEGNLTIYGDLVLEEGSTLEFLGPASVVNITGKVDIKDNVTITGNFLDVSGKF